ncbi:hypothetical protein [Actinoplanes sp. NPDC026619]|uniref:hypothetical protein n=1 Tax=Actinoplanes sp. NPDC026619 TaxID=3155798 RepID=UPI0033EB6B65
MKTHLALALSIPLVLVGAAPAAATATSRRTVAAGETWLVPSTTKLSSLTLAAGGTIAAPAGDVLTLTVNGVEQGSKLTATGATTTAIVPGTYRGDVVVSVTEANDVAFGGLTFPFRQAVFVGPSGVADAKSVRAAVARDGSITSTGEAFNGVYVDGATYALRNPRISLTGNGRSDFVGYGAAIVGNNGARLTVDGADIDNRGAVRTGVVADGGSTVVVKNSRIHTADGVLPAGYVSTVDTSLMEDVPWMLGLSGNARATNLLGNGTKAAYVNSAISSQGWGVLSTDNGQNTQLASINSSVRITGKDGYGSYAIGNATERFLGSSLDVATYAAINRGGSLYYGDSSRAAVSSVNSSLGLGLSASELARLTPRRTTINSDKWGVMWHGAGTVDVSGGTVINTRRATFLDKGQQVGITVDGSKGARLNPADGVLLQMIEDDDPGPQMVDGKLVNTGVYTEPAGTPAKAASFDVTAAHGADAVATFTDIALKGDFYNAIRGSAATGKNLVLTLDGGSLAGRVTSAVSRHRVATITSADYQELGVVTDTPAAAVNNGALVALTGGADWTVTGTSYLTKLTLGAGSAVTAPHGRQLVMTVDGVRVNPRAGGTWSGAIVLAVQ